MEKGGREGKKRDGGGMEGENRDGREEGRERRGMGGRESRKRREMEKE